MSPETRTCQNCKSNFTIEPEDFAFYEKIKVPPPTFCAQCRFQRRLLFRNERNFYKRDCDLCGKSVVSRVSPDKTYPMYCKDCWWSDQWSPYTYGQEYDFSRSFFEQWNELFCSVPHISIFNSNCINSDWVNQETDDKNCYLNIGGFGNEDSAYNTYEIAGKNCYDNYWLLNSDTCSNNVHCERCFSVHFSLECHDSMNTILSYDCRNCSNVIGCAGLRNKHYCIFNEQYTKDGYEAYLAEHPYSSHTGFLWWKEKSKSVWNKSPHRENTIFKCDNVSGNALSESKNAHDSWESTKLENCKHMYISGWLRDSYDCSCFGAAELAYECSSSGGGYDSKFLFFCLSNDPLKKMTIVNVEYSAETTSSSNCFGCVGIRGAEYVILNKKYSKEEYLALLPRIKAHMMEMPYVDNKGREYRYGEFYPSEFSPFGYNETTAPDIFPLTQEQAIQRGYVWSEYVSDVQHQFSDYVLPDAIADVGDDVVEKYSSVRRQGKRFVSFLASWHSIGKLGFRFLESHRLQDTKTSCDCCCLQCSTIEHATFVKRVYKRRTRQGDLRWYTARVVIKRK